MYLKSSVSRFSVFTLVVLMAVAVAVLAGPRVKASFRFLPVSRAMEGYLESRELPSSRMLTLIRFTEDSIALQDHYRFHDGLSFLYYLRGLDIHTPALERRPAYRRSEAEAIETVRQAPAQPEAWLRIASVRSILRDEPETIIQPWKMSVFTGRTHSTLLVPRLEVALPYLAHMDGESRSMLKDQLLLAWQLKPRELLRILKSHDPQLLAAGELLEGTHPALLMEMEDGLEKVR